MTFAEKLRELREAKGWSQKELAERSGVSQQGLAHWEHGDREPGFAAVQSICKALGVRCTIFDDCEYAKIEDGRGRGRPPKADAPEAKPAAKLGRPKKGGA